MDFTNTVCVALNLILVSFSSWEMSSRAVLSRMDLC